MDGLLRFTYPFVVLAIILCCAATAAQAREGPWCAQMNVGRGTMTEDCSFRTFEQCRLMVIAGNRGFCSANPRYGVRPARRYRYHLGRPHSSRRMDSGLRRMFGSIGSKT